MDDGRGQDDYEERLKEVFNSFDTSGCGSLSPEELSDLCQSLHLDDAAPTLIHTLLQNLDHFTARVDFDQFKHALILVLSSTIEPPQAEQEPSPKPESPEIQPKFVKGGKRYGRRSTPEFLEPVSDLSEVANVNPADEDDLEDNYDSAVPRKRERWNAHESSTEEYEAEGQMHLWNPDEPSTARGSVVPRVEERLREACEELAIAWDGCAAHSELLALCEHLGLEANGDALLNLTDDGVMNVQEFVSRVVNNKPPTPSASTPYRQLKRHHSTQPFDEGGRRISALTSTIGMRLFSTLDDGSGFTPAEYVLDAWMEEGIENSAEILQVLNFNLEGKLSLGELTVALENELLSTKNQVHQAALASFKAEIRYLLERVDREIREKAKLQSDLEKAEKQKTQLATEVDEHHSAIEHTNNLNLRKLEQDYKEKLMAVRSELTKEMDQMQQQAGLQREELEAEIRKIREEESLLRDHLSISVKENRRLETELLDSTEKLTEAQSQIAKLQENLENIMKDKFGDLDPGSADFFLQEERIKQLRCGYEAQCRELRDRVDELQSELREFHSLGRAHESGGKPLSEELESKSPGTESDPGIGPDEVQPFSMSLEAEMMLEQLKEQHLQEMEQLQNQLQSKITEFERTVEEQEATHKDQKSALILQHQEEARGLREQLAGAQSHAERLQNQLQQAEQDRTRLEQKQAAEREELQNQQEDEAANLRQQLLEAHTQIADLEDQLNSLESQQAEMEENLLAKTEELKNQHAAEVSKLTEELTRLQRQKDESERRLLDDWEREKRVLEESHQNKLQVQLEEAKLLFEKEQSETVKTLTEQWREERAQQDEQNSKTLQLLLEEEMLRLVREQEEKEDQLRERWASERALLEKERLQLQEQLQQRERRLKEDWERERLQLEEDYEGMIQERLKEEREKLEAEREEDERRTEKLMAEERERLEERHGEALRELSNKHAEERDALSAALDRLREDIATERYKATRLAEENVCLQKNIAALKEGDLKEAKDELIQTLEDLEKEKLTAQQAADSFNKQISELHSQSQRLEDDNGLLVEKNAQSVADIGSLREQLAELMKENETREALHSEEKTKAFQVESMETRLSSLVEECRTVDKESAGLRSQLAKAQEQLVSADETFKVVNRQSARLKSDLRVLQQERDSLKHEVAVLHKQLQNANEKNQILERALHPGGLQSQSRKPNREDLSWLMEQEQQLLRQENEKLKAEVHSISSDLVQSRERIRQLDATILSLSKQKQQSHSSFLKALEQENFFLKQELEPKAELPRGCDAEQSHAELDSLLQENESLKTQVARISTHMMESFHAQYGGHLPPSPQRGLRGQQRGDDPDNMQDERERKMKKMEERMREIELSLHNVKLLLKEKVTQLKDQLHRNGKADVLIKDLYVENSQLIEALEITEQRQKITEKKNYLLEEKISSLNKIVRDLNPSTLSSLPYNYKCP
uniref:EF-hand domain-containing protein n=1 Tax=Poecilia mexicana TaxID=48701 RepID=A0A3B3WIH1_9TELE